MVCLFFNSIALNKVFLWLLVSLFFIFFEIGCPGLFFFLSFAIGSFVTALASLLLKSLLLQVCIFFTSSLITFLIFHLWIKKKAQNIPHNKKTNKDLLCGKIVIVKKDIKGFKPGVVKIDGALWTAYSNDSGSILAGSYVKIIKINGACVIVGKVKHN